MAARKKAKAKKAKVAVKKSAKKPVTLKAKKPAAKPAQNGNGLPKVPPRRNASKSEKQLELFKVIEHPLLDRLRELNPDFMTPLEALETLHKMREELKA